MKHEYDTPWDAADPQLRTCNPGSVQFVNHGLAPQIVEENEEIVFSYDIIFKVRHSSGNGRV